MFKKDVHPALCVTSALLEGAVHFVRSLFSESISVSDGKLHSNTHSSCSFPCRVWRLQVCWRAGFQVKILLTNRMLFSNDKCKALPQAGGTEHTNAGKSVGKDLGFVLVQQLNMGQQQHLSQKRHLKQGCCQQETWNYPSPLVSKSKAPGEDMSSFSQRISRKIQCVQVA